MSGINVDDLVRPDKVHSSIFTNPEIFELELQRIFYRSWVYLAHDSEVPEVGDYVVRSIGRKSVIISRSEAGGIHVLLNRCRHRGNAICSLESGNSSFFRCAYHGWTYKNDGQLVGVPFPDAYDGSLDKDSLSLTPLPESDSYQGFIFGSLAPQSIGLSDYLGPVKAGIDTFVAASPSGRVELKAGCQRTVFHGNWKYVGMDGYHASFTHRSVFALLQRKGMRAGANKDAGLAAASVAYPNGHCRLLGGRNSSNTVDEFIRPLLETDEGQAYIALLEEKYGPDEARRVLVEARDPHVGIWPNMQIINAHVRVIQPIAADKTEVLLYPALLADTPADIDAERLRRHEWFYGPAAFGQPDDAEMFERNQQGLQCDLEPWLLLSRGMHREETRPDGTVVGHITDEVPQRSQMRAWAKAMAEADDR
jgi:phenylpropionate dioxygenase-like ring-hydroxylating dioxygenase large terminal subunit